jgi:hypothetical protein
MAPEARSLLDQAMTGWAEQKKALPKTLGGKRYRPSIYSFAYWLIRYSGLVHPAGRTIPGEKEIRDTIAEIKQGLDAIEDHMIWQIKPEQRFKIGQRVEFGRRARERGFPQRKRSAKGIVKAIDGFNLVVLLDFYARPKSFYHAFFNPVSGPKVF